jgi:hypothetical protein
MDTVLPFITTTDLVFKGIIVPELIPNPERQRRNRRKSNLKRQLSHATSMYIITTAKHGFGQEFITTQIAPSFI